MLDYIKKLFRVTAVSDDGNRVESPYTYVVEEPSFGDAISKLSKEKGSEEHLVFLDGKSNSSVTTVTGSTQASKSAGLCCIASIG